MDSFELKRQEIGDEAWNKLYHQFCQMEIKRINKEIEELTKTHNIDKGQPQLMVL